MLLQNRSPHAYWVQGTFSFPKDANSFLKEAWLLLIAHDLSSKCAEFPFSFLQPFNSFPLIYVNMCLSDPIFSPDFLCLSHSVFSHVSLALCCLRPISLFCSGKCQCCKWGTGNGCSTASVGLTSHPLTYEAFSWLQDQNICIHRQNICTYPQALLPSTIPFLVTSVKRFSGSTSVPWLRNPAKFSMLNDSRDCLSWISWICTFEPLICKSLLRQDPQKVAHQPGVC